jgi:hypothetical protein
MKASNISGAACMVQHMQCYALAIHVSKSPYPRRSTTQCLCLGNFSPGAEGGNAVWAFCTVNTLKFRLLDNLFLPGLLDFKIL